MSTFMKVVKTILLLISGLAIIIIGQLLGELPTRWYLFHRYLILFILLLRFWLFWQ